MKIGVPQVTRITFCETDISSIPCSRVRLSVTPWTAARQASLSFTNSWSLLKLMSIESVMPSNRLILCRPLLLLPSIFPSIRVFSSELVLRIRWPKDWIFSFSFSPSDEDSGWLLSPPCLAHMCAHVRDPQFCGLFSSESCLEMITTLSFEVM